MPPDMRDCDRFAEIFKKAFSRPAARIQYTRYGAFCMEANGLEVYDFTDTGDLIAIPKEEQELRITAYREALGLMKP